MAHLRPGPLMSPLSSSLSAIVADSLRRGVHDSPSSAAAARRRPKLDALRKVKSQRPPAEALDLQAGGSSLKDDVTGDKNGSGHGEESGASGDGGRKQSISAALGEFLRLKFRRERDNAMGGGRDEEGG
ncbi:MAG: hypothetical protein Q9172_006183 [Xanthocarpia lactea]